MVAMPRCCHLVALLLRNDGRVAAGLPDAAKVEPRLEVVDIGEHLWQQEVEQAPQLPQVVLQRRACTSRATSQCVLRHTRHQHCFGSKVETTFRHGKRQIIGSNADVRRYL